MLYVVWKGASGKELENSLWTWSNGGKLRTTATLWSCMKFESWSFYEITHRIPEKPLAVQTVIILQWSSSKIVDKDKQQQQQQNKTDYLGNEERKGGNRIDKWANKPEDIPRMRLQMEDEKISKWGLPFAPWLIIKSTQFTALWLVVK